MRRELCGWPDLSRIPAFGSVECPLFRTGKAVLDRPKTIVIGLRPANFGLSTYEPTSSTILYLPKLASA